jgi:uncharacterized membrane protein YdbT with pleckstrin-like domain
MSPLAEPTSVRADSAVIVPRGLIQDGEIIVLAVKPSGFFVVLASLPVVLAVAAIWIATYVLHGWLPKVVPDRAIAALCALAVAVRLIVAILQWLARFYVLTDRRVIRVKGVLRVDIFECPLTRVQNTYLTLALAERVFGMGTIWFATAGTGGPEAAWLMIAKPREIHQIVVEYIRLAQNGKSL